MAQLWSTPKYPLPSNVRLLYKIIPNSENAEYVKEFTDEQIGNMDMEALDYVFADDWFLNLLDNFHEYPPATESEQQPATESELQPATESELQPAIATQTQRSFLLQQAQAEDEEEDLEPPPPEHYEENWEGLLHKWRDGSKLLAQNCCQWWLHDRLLVQSWKSF
jgi:hypothetical protein